MMFYKPLVSLLVALAAASTVVASATPVARCGCDEDYPPPPAPTVSECNTGSISCCNTMTSTDNPVAGQVSGLLGLGALLDATLGVGLSCLPIVGAVQW